jgi:transposase
MPLLAPQVAFPGNGPQRADIAEITALKKEVAKLKAERDILKKAAAYFARDAT